jgi:hypothetical protein
MALASCAVCCLTSPLSQAGPYADELAKCLVSSTTKEDRVAMIDWLVAAASLNPAVTSVRPVSNEQLDKVNKSLGTLVTVLLTERCRDQSQKAIQYEGPATLEISFNVLGQVAGRELFASPAVAVGMGGLKKYLDQARLKELVQGANGGAGPKAPAPATTPSRPN